MTGPNALSRFDQRSARRRRLNSSIHDLHRVERAIAVDIDVAVAAVGEDGKPLGLVRQPEQRASHRHGDHVSRSPCRISSGACTCVMYLLDS